MQVVGQSATTFQGEGVVDGGANSADVAVALQAIHPLLLRSCKECLLQIGVAQAEGDIHQGAIRLIDDSDIVEIGMLIQSVVNESRLRSEEHTSELQSRRDL